MHVTRLNAHIEYRYKLASKYRGTDVKRVDPALSSPRCCLRWCWMNTRIYIFIYRLIYIYILFYYYYFFSIHKQINKYISLFYFFWYTRMQYADIIVRVFLYRCVYGKGTTHGVIACEGSPYMRATSPLYRSSSRNRTRAKTVIDPVVSTAEGDGQGCAVLPSPSPTVWGPRMGVHANTETVSCVGRRPFSLTPHRARAIHTRAAQRRRTPLHFRRGRPRAQDPLEGPWAITCLYYLDIYMKFFFIYSFNLNLTSFFFYFDVWYFNFIFDFDFIFLLYIYIRLRGGSCSVSTECIYIIWFHIWFSNILIFVFHFFSSNMSFLCFVFALTILCFHPTWYNLPYIS